MKEAKFIRFIMISLLLPLLLGACAAPRSMPVKTEMTEKSYVLGAGDKLRIIVYGQEELSGEFTIDPAGNVAVPLVKDVKAAGATVTELQQMITAALSPQYLKDPKVSIEVIEYRGVYILGEVRTPGKYPYVPNMTVLQAVAVAGGHTYRANEDSADVTRLDHDLLKTFQLHSTDMILPGDTIVIKRRWF